MTDPADHFALADGIAYLNHAAVAPWPRRTTEAVARFADENLRRGAQHYPAWLAVEERLRERLARLLNAAGPADVALLKNTSEGLSLVAHGLGWAAGDNVVGIRADFPSNRVVWESLARHGVEFRAVDVHASADPEGALIDACDRSTRLLAVSSVHYASGQRLDLERLGRHCRAAGILYCVDAIQSLGVVPFDVQACGIDFLAADGHKWLLGPEGVAVFYCRPELRERLILYQYGWHMLEHPGDYDREDWAPSGSATRFECGSPNMVGIHGLEASLSLIEEVGVPTISAAISRKIEYLSERASKIAGINQLTPAQRGRRAGILTLTFPAGTSVQDLHGSLMSRGIVCAARGGGIRLSPHWYTPDRALDVACDALAEGFHDLSQNDL